MRLFNLLGFMCLWTAVGQTAGGIVERIVSAGVRSLPLVAVFFSNGQAAASIGGQGPGTVKWDTTEQIEAEVLKMMEYPGLRPAVEMDLDLKGRRILKVVIGSKNGGGLGYLRLELQPVEGKPAFFEIGSQKNSVGLQGHDTGANTSGVLVGVGWIFDKDLNALDLAFLPKVTGIKDVYEISNDGFNQEVVERDRDIWHIEQTASSDPATKVTAEHEFEWTYEQSTRVEKTRAMDHVVTQGAHVNVTLERGLAAGDAGGVFGSVSVEGGYSWEKSVTDHLSEVNVQETTVTASKRTQFTYDDVSNKKVFFRAARFQTSFRAKVKRTLELEGPGEFKFTFNATVDTVDQTVVFIRIMDINEVTPATDDWAGFDRFPETEANTASLVSGALKE